MSWWAIDIRTDVEHRAAISTWLVAHTGQAVEERDDGTVVGFAPDAAAADAVIAALSATRVPAAAACRRVEPVDWSTQWRQGLGPRRFGRLVVTPTWAFETSRPWLATVVLDPESAFGSGEHGSTRAALTLLERHLRPGDRVLDLGSGSGILAISSVKLGAARATGIENDTDSYPVALANAGRNGVSDRVDFLEGDAGDLAPLLGPVDLILSNIVLNANTALLPSIVFALRPGGLAVFSGMEEPEAARFRPVLSAAGFIVRDEATDAGWWAVAAERA
jgi:ribosomal protein L11 methyltransferase